MHLPASLQNLIEKLRLLPGVGEKTAARYAFFILKMDQGDQQRLGESISTLGAKLSKCSICQNITEENPCPLCSSSERDSSSICVLEDPLDLINFEKSGIYRGCYHVLYGVISPLSGVSPRDLKISELLARVQNDPQIAEIIIATNATTEGEATATYIAHTLTKQVDRQLKITRLGRGLPTGSDLEYADPGTLAGAMTGRTELIQPNSEEK